jgi:hypothetical protein
MHPAILAIPTSSMCQMHVTTGSLPRPDTLGSDGMDSPDKWNDPSCRDGSDVRETR